MSPSITSWLSDAPTASTSASCRNGRFAAASVTRNDSVVAIRGAIIPEPFDTPSSVTSRPSTVQRATARLGTESLVIIARATPRLRSVASPSRSAGSAAATLSTSMRGPMRPVDEQTTSCSRTPSRLATSACTRRQSRTPSLPVPALAMPALTRIARSGFPFFSSSRPTTTGAPGAELVV